MKKILIVFGMMMLMMVSIVAADYTIYPLNAKSGEECYVGSNFVLPPSDGDTETGTSRYFRTQNDWYGCGIQPRVLSPDNLSSATGMTLRVLLEQVNQEGVNVEPDGLASYVADGYIRGGCEEEILFGGGFADIYPVRINMTSAGIAKQWLEFDLTEACLDIIRDNVQIEYDPINDPGYFVLVDEVGFSISMPTYNLQFTGGQPYYSGVTVYEWEILITEASAPVDEETGPTYAVGATPGSTSGVAESAVVTREAEAQTESTTPEGLSDGAKKALGFAAIAGAAYLLMNGGALGSSSASRARRRRK